MMFQKTCSACGKFTWHNKVIAKNGDGRCTYCGTPVTTNQAGKREHQVELRRKQCAKMGKTAY